MKKLIFVILLLTGCAYINYLPTNEYAIYLPTPSVEVLWEKPKKSHIVIGRISAVSEDFSEAALFKKVKIKAMKIGAHAIIVGGSDRTSKSYGYPVYGGGFYMFSTTERRIEVMAIRFVQTD